MTTDCIEKKVFLRTTRNRVWRAISDSSEFEKWFGVRFNGPFIAGAHMRGSLVGTTVDAEIAKAQRAHEGPPFEITVEKIEPETLFSFRWHPYAVEKGVDYSAEPTTLVEFTLEEVDGGVQLTVSESGFDRIPLERRVKAFAMNEQGWAIQMKLLASYLGHAQ